MRKKLSFLVSFSVFICLTFANVPFQTLFRSNCDGTFELAPNLPIGFNLKLPLIRNSFNAILDATFERVNCVCPEVTHADFLLAFDPFAILINAANEVPAPVHPCLAENFPSNFAGLDFLHVKDLPETCSSQTYSNSSPSSCFFKFNNTLFETNTEFALYECPQSWFPGISITCSGNGCENLIRPCTTNEDCGEGSLSCVDVESYFPTDGEDIIKLIFNGIFMSVIPESSESITCFEAPQDNGLSPKSPDNDIFTNLFTTFANLFYGETGTFNHLSICLPNNTESIFELLPTAEVVPSETESCFLPNQTAPWDLLKSFLEFSDDTKTLTFEKATEVFDISMLCHDPLSNSCTVPQQPDFCTPDLYNFYVFYSTYSSVHQPIGAPFPLTALDYIYQLNMDDYFFLSFNFGENGFVPIYKPHQMLLYSSWTPLNKLFDLSPKSISLSGFESLKARMVKFLVTAASMNPVLSYTTYKALSGFIGAAYWGLSQNDNILSCYDGLIGVDAIVEMAAAEVSSVFISYDYDGSGELESNNLFGQDEITPFGEEFGISFSESSININMAHSKFYQLKPILIPYFDLNNDGFLTVEERDSIIMGFFGVMIINSEFPELVSGVNPIEPQFVVDTFMNFDYHSSVYITGGNVVFEDNSYFHLSIQIDKVSQKGLSYDYIVNQFHYAYDLCYSADTDSNQMIDELEYQNFIGVYQNSQNVIETVAVSLLQLVYNRPSPINYYEASDFLVGGHDFLTSLYLLQKNTDLIIHVEGISAWDGVDSEGNYVAKKLDSINPFPVDNNQAVDEQMNIFTLSCDNTLAFKSFGLGFQFNNQIDELAQSLAQLVYDVLSCGTSPLVTKEEFITRYGTWDPLFWLSILDSNAPIVQHDGIFLNYLNFTTLPLIANLPSTCTYERYLNEGICELDFIGLKELLLIDVTLRLKTQRCSNFDGEDFFSSWSIDCLGKDCYIFQGLTSCDSQCQGSLGCYHANSFLGKVTDFTLSILPSSISSSTIIQEIQGYLNHLEIDWVELTFSSNYNQDFCSPLLFDQYSNSSSSSSSSSSCYGGASWDNSLHNILINLLGSSNQPTNLIKKLHFCTFDPTLLIDLDLLQWINSLVTHDGELTYLGPSFLPVGQVCGTTTCSPYAQCIGGSQCVCNSGYLGDGITCKDINECTQTPSIANCTANSICLNSPGSYSCQCLPGFVLLNGLCVDVNECSNNNGGCSSNAICTNTIGSFSCSCKSGYNGTGFVCDDINECLVNNGGCHFKAACTNTPGNRVCTCLPGYFGNGWVCSDINECNLGTDDCDNVSEYCYNVPGTYYCRCLAGFDRVKGFDHCQDINECSVNNGGCFTNSTMCVNSVGSYSCQCLPGYLPSNSSSKLCNPDLRTADTLYKFTILGRWLFNGNSIDSSPSRQNFNVGNNPYIPFYQKNTLTNFAILLSGSSISSISTVQYALGMTFEIIFSLDSLLQPVDILTLTTSLTNPTFIPLNARIGTNGQIVFSRNTTQIGASSPGVIKTGRTHYLIISLRNDPTMLVFLDGVHLGSFNIANHQNALVFSRLGSGLKGSIDEYNILRGIVFINTAGSRFDTLACTKSCVSPNKCYNTPQGETC